MIRPQIAEISVGWESIGRGNWICRAVSRATLGTQLRVTVASLTLVPFFSIDCAAHG